MAIRKVSIELDHAAIRDLLTSEGVDAELARVAGRVASAAGEGFVVTDRREAGGSSNPDHKGRAARGVVAATYGARLAEARDKALSRAVAQCS